MSVQRFLLAIGAAVLCAAAIRLAAPAQAAAPNHAQRWEYMCKSDMSATPRGLASDIQTAANQAGQEGWEMVASVGANVFCFKRPLP
ncbi:MAG: hypothetical protein QM778_06555 [Myxococcales bacterium]